MPKTRLEYPHGTVYVGEVVAGKRDGHGVIEYSILDGWLRRDIARGRKYVGQWRNDKRHGQGTLSAGDMIIYRGEWYDDQPHGEGECLFLTDRYQGQFHHGKRHGRGYIRYLGGRHYDGEWVDDECTGYGTWQIGDGDTKRLIYEGNWLKGKYHGQGRLYLSDDPTHYYEGEFVAGKCEGKGRLYKQGKINYDGQWEAGKACGCGTIYYASAEDRYYQGNVVNGLPEGTGELYVAHRLKYKGQWLAGRYHGSGSLHLPHASYLEATFVAGLAQGSGKLYIAGKLKYDGQFVKGSPNGIGIFYLTDDGASYYQGQFVAGRREGNGRLYRASRLVYEGSWQADLYHGKGTVYLANGQRRDSEFKCGKYNGPTIIYHPDGSKTFITFRNGVAQGMVRLEHSSGDVYERLSSSAWPHDQGRWTFSGLAKQIFTAAIARKYEGGRYYDFQADAIKVLLANLLSFEWVVRGTSLLNSLRTQLIERLGEALANYMICDSDIVTLPGLRLAPLARADHPLREALQAALQPLLPARRYLFSVPNFIDTVMMRALYHYYLGGRMHPQKQEAIKNVLTTCLDTSDIQGKLEQPELREQLGHALTEVLCRYLYLTKARWLRRHDDSWVHVSLKRRMIAAESSPLREGIEGAIAQWLEVAIPTTDPTRETIFPKKSSEKTGAGNRFFALPDVDGGGAGPSAPPASVGGGSSVLPPSYDGAQVPLLSDDDSDADWGEDAGLSDESLPRYSALFS